jgi:hypothetical protein
MLVAKSSSFRRRQQQGVASWKVLGKRARLLVPYLVRRPALATWQARLGDSRIFLFMLFFPFAVFISIFQVNSLAC